VQLLDLAAVQGLSRELSGEFGESDVFAPNKREDQRGKEG